MAWFFAVGAEAGDTLAISVSPADSPYVLSGTPQQGLGQGTNVDIDPSTLKCDDDGDNSDGNGDSDGDDGTGAGGDDGGDDGGADEMDDVTDISDQITADMEA